MSIVALLLVLALQGCSAAKQNSPETDALLRAARTGSPDTVRTLLVSPNVDINGTDENGNTALIEAARLGHDEVVSALLIAKARIDTKNKDGKTALMLAAEAGHEDVVAVLTQAGAGK